MVSRGAVLSALSIRATCNDTASFVNEFAITIPRLPLAETWSPHPTLASSMRETLRIRNRQSSSIENSQFTILFLSETQSRHPLSANLSLVPGMFRPCHGARCFLNVPSMFLDCPLLGPSLSPPCSLYVPCIFFRVP